MPVGIDLVVHVLWSFGLGWGVAVLEDEQGWR